MPVQTWSGVLVSSFQNLWSGVVLFVPSLVFALVVLLVGWFIAAVVGRAVERAMRILKIDHALRSLGLEEPVERAGWKLDSGAFVGGLVKWFVLLVFFLAAFDALQLHAVTDFLRQVVLTYLPKVVVAALVLLAGAVLGDAARRVVAGAARAAQMPSAGFLGSVAKWAIWVFAISAALMQLGVFPELILTIVQAFVYMVALAGGLAFGFGGKDAAAQIIDRVRGEIANHRS